MKSGLWLSFLSVLVLKLSAQDTFSIVAADSTTREVGSAGASCVDLFVTSFTDPSFLGDLLSDTGAINTQSFYLTSNQNNARIRMRAGDTPMEIIDWLGDHDAQGDPSTRQYGIVGFTGSNVSAAGYTGFGCIDYKNHITGSIDGIYYSIQGNILLGPEVLDSMEARFLNATGDLACRLMAALQGAKMVGADTRCTEEGTSSRFAFLKVAQSGDPYGQPSLKLGVKTHQNSQIEPVDSLQSVFDAQHSCMISGVNESQFDNMFNLFPNPAGDELTLESHPSLIGSNYAIIDAAGRNVITGTLADETDHVEIQHLIPGIYIIQIGNRYRLSFIKN